MVAYQDHRLVVLSVVISILGAYAARDLSERVSAARGSAWLAWLIGGATADGIGTWSMHYTGMLAFHLPVPVQYDVPMVLLSLFVGIGGSAAALFFASRNKMRWPATLAAAVFMGGVGISGLHYTAMEAMRLQGMHHYSPALVTLSVALAIISCWLALALKFLFPGGRRGGVLRKHAATVMRGAANPVMHYAAMAAVSFTYSSQVPDLSHAVRISTIGVFGISIVPVMVLVVALLTSLTDRLHKQRVLLDELFEQAPQAVAMMSADNRVVRVNREFARLFGYNPQEIRGRRLSELIIPDELREEDQRYTDLVAQGHRVDAESVRRRKDGSRLEVSIVRVPVSLPGGQVAIYAIFRDISERIRAEDELHRSFEQLRALAARLENIREEERARVAREIHDELGQALTAIKIGLASLIRELHADQLAKIESILNLVDETILTVRRIATELRPGILDDLGLVAAVEWAAEQFEARTGIKSRLVLPKVDIVLDQERATAIFRIFQETLTNVARHANATQMEVRLGEENGDIVLEVCDNGRGVSEEQLSTGRSLGILGMRERALLLGGELTIRGAPGKGTTVKLRIPDIRRIQSEPVN